MSKESILFSSKERSPDHFLHGCAFHDSDIIIGNFGYRKFRHNRNMTIDPGHDGAYITLNRDGDSITIGTDHGGYSHLFFYSVPGFWAISNSFLDLVGYISRSNGRLTADVVSLSGFCIRSALGDQPSTLSTAVKEISILPPGKKIVATEATSVSPATFGLVDIDTRLHDLPSTEEEALELFISIWLSRVSTILQSGLRISCDITGGRDSRAVLAIILRVAKVLDAPLSELVHFNSNRSLNKDFEVANQIAEEFSLELGRNSPFNSMRPDHEDAYRIWRALYPGAYHRLHIPSIARSHEFVWFSGGGGESHRRVVGIGWCKEVEDLVIKAQADFPSVAIHERFLKQFRLDLESLRFGREAEFPSLLLHFRNFRERFHHGRRSGTLNSICPLSSQYLRNCSNLSSKRMWESGGLLAKVIADTTPRLLNIGFDKPYDLFKDIAAARLNRIYKLYDIDTSGRAYFDSEPVVGARGYRGVDVLGMIADDFQKNSERASKLGLFSSDQLTNSENVMCQALEAGGFTKSSEGRLLSHIVLAGELVRYC